MAKFEPVTIKVEVEFSREDRDRLDAMLKKLGDFIEQFRPIEDDFGARAEQAELDDWHRRPEEH